MKNLKSIINKIGTATEILAIAAVLYYTPQAAWKFYKQMNAISQSFNWAEESQKGLDEFYRIQKEIKSLDTNNPNYQQKRQKLYEKSTSIRNSLVEKTLEVDTLVKDNLTKYGNKENK